MFERFARDARAAVKDAEAEARELGQPDDRGRAPSPRAHPPDPAPRSLRRSPRPGSTATASSRRSPPSASAA